MVDPVILWTFTIAYVIVVLFLAYKGYQKTKTNVDYLIAGRSVHPALFY